MTSKEKKPVHHVQMTEGKRNINYPFGNIKYCHGYGKSVCDKCYCYKCFEDPFEKDPGLKIRKIIVTYNKLDKLVAGDKCKDYSRHRHYHIL